MIPCLFLRGKDGPGERGGGQGKATRAGHFCERMGCRTPGMEHRVSEDPGKAMRRLEGVSCCMRAEGRETMRDADILQECFAGIDYPRDLEGILGHARSRGLDQGVIDMLARLPDRLYDGKADLNRAIGDIE